MEQNTLKINPCVILVDPEKPRNIGFAARAMRCNGLTELRVVSTRFPKMHSAAYITGTSAREILNDAKFYENLDDALADVEQAVAFSRRSFEFAPGECDLPQIADYLVQEAKVALVFGRESQGLHAEELAKCSLLCSIPTENNMSYNLGQAVSIALYQIIGALKASDYKKQDPLSSVAQREALLERWKLAVPKYLSDERKLAYFKQMLEKRELTQREVKLFFGALQELMTPVQEVSALDKEI